MRAPDHHQQQIRRLIIAVAAGMGRSELKRAKTGSASRQQERAAEAAAASRRRGVAAADAEEVRRARSPLFPLRASSRSIACRKSGGERGCDRLLRASLVR